MKFPQIPSIDNAWDNVIVKTLSPSTFAWVSSGCGYQVLLQKALATFDDKTLILPHGRSAILGTIIHKMYERAIKGEMRSIGDLKTEWERLLKVKIDELTSLYPTLRNVDLNDYDKRNSAIRYSMGMMRNSRPVPANPIGGRIVSSEKRLDCPGIGLMGTADKIVQDNGMVDVIDFKSGHVTDDNGEIKNEYQVQLHLYAAMCEHKALGTPRRLSLVDIDGKYFDVPYCPEYCTQLLEDVKSTIDRLNDSVKTRSFQPLVKPELGMCPLCACRHVCHYRDIPADAPFRTLSGVVTDMPSTNMYVLLCGGEKYYVSGLDAYDVDYPDDYLGKNLVFLNVVRSSPTADEHTFKITDNTLAYEQL